MRMGLSMRHCAAEGYREDRDSIARDWYDFLSRYRPQLQWMLLPNLPEAAMASYLEQWELDGFILTGGSDIGLDTRRDRAERAILEYATTRHKPVLGICRGFQFIQLFLGGELQPCTAEHHVATTHPLQLTSGAAHWGIDEIGPQVNSFHHLGILRTELAAPLCSFGECDQWVEWAAADDPPLMGLMWHPERPGGNPEFDAKVVLQFFSDERRK